MGLFAHNSIGEDKDRGPKSIYSTVLIVLLLSFMFLVVWLMVTRFSDKAFEEATTDIKIGLINSTEKKAQELALVMDDMLSSGLIAASYMSDDIENMFEDSRIDIIKESNNNLYAVALVDQEGKGISTNGDIDLSDSDYFSASQNPRFSDRKSVV